MGRPISLILIPSACAPSELSERCQTVRSGRFPTLSSVQTSLESLVSCKQDAEDDEVYAKCRSLSLYFFRGPCEQPLSVAGKLIWGQAQAGDLQRSAPWRGALATAADAAHSAVGVGLGNARPQPKRRSEVRTCLPQSLTEDEGRFGKPDVGRKGQLGQLRRQVR